MKNKCPLTSYNVFCKKTLSKELKTEKKAVPLQPLLQLCMLHRDT